MTKIKELFGIPTKRTDEDWKKILKEQKCPYTGKKCIKVRKSNAEVSIGACTVGYGGYDEIMICPNRLLENRQIFIDCVHLLRSHEPGNELHIISEVRIPGGSVDYLLVSVQGKKVVDFVGIELQTLDTTGSLWSERSDFVKERGEIVFEKDLIKKSFGMNWKMSAKTILVQMHHKVQTFGDLGKHMVLVIQDCFKDYIAREFDFSHITPSRPEDPFHFHVYRVADEGDLIRLQLRDRLSTDADGIAKCLGSRGGVKTDLSTMIGYLEAKISKETLLKAS